VAKYVNSLKIFVAVQASQRKSYKTSIPSATLNQCFENVETPEFLRADGQAKSESKEKAKAN
jgi:hypothetical protein